MKVGPPPSAPAGGPPPSAPAGIGIVGSKHSQPQKDHEAVAEKVCDFTRLLRTYMV
jgi:hypothetical protein